jgi:hypothetical protein
VRLAIRLSFPCPIFTTATAFPLCPSHSLVDKTHTFNLLSHASLAIDMRGMDCPPLCNRSLICYHYFHLLYAFFYSVSFFSLVEYIHNTTYISPSTHLLSCKNKCTALTWELESSCYSCSIHINSASVTHSSGDSLTTFSGPRRLLSIPQSRTPQAS